MVDTSRQLCHYKLSLATSYRWGQATHPDGKMEQGGPQLRWHSSYHNNGRDGQGSTLETLGLFCGEINTLEI